MYMQIRIRFLICMYIKTHGSQYRNQPGHCLDQPLGLTTRGSLSACTFKRLTGVSIDTNLGRSDPLCINTPVRRLSLRICKSEFVASDPRMWRSDRLHAGANLHVSVRRAETEGVYDIARRHTTLSPTEGPLVSVLVDFCESLVTRFLAVGCSTLAPAGRFAQLGVSVNQPCSCFFFLERHPETYMHRHRRLDVTVFRSSPVSK